MLLRTTLSSLPRDGFQQDRLKVGDLTCVNPTQEIVDSKTQEDCVIVTEQNIREIEFSPANIELTIRRLKQRGVLPLRNSNPNLYLLSRLLGHLFSDGSLTHNSEIRNNKPYSHFTLDFCISDEEDYLELKTDLARLGVKAQKSFVSSHIISKDGRSHRTTTLHVKMRDTALCTLLRALGSPVGSKVRNCPPLPEWLKRSPPLVQREFLAAYMGGDGESPRIIKSNPGSAIRLTFHRINDKKDEALRFAKELESLFTNFGVAVNCISSNPGYLRSDGHTTSEIEIRFKLSQENVLKICQRIGYRYCKRKSLQAKYVAEYPKNKISYPNKINGEIRNGAKIGLAWLYCARNFFQIRLVNVSC